MSISVKVILKQNKQNKAGEFPLYLRITKDRISRFQTLGITVKESYWDDKEKKVKKGHLNAQRINHFISQKIAEAQAKALDWEITKKSIKNKSLRIEMNKSNDEYFTDYFDKYIKGLNVNKKSGTHNRALVIFNKLHRYVKSDKILFKDIDLEFLKQFEFYLSNKLGNRINTIHSNLKMIRKLFNDAVREELIPYELNPFSKFKLQTEKSDKQYLTEDEVLKIELLDLKDKPRINDTRNIFLFACYAGGVRVSDLLQLMWKDFSGTHINFTQQKTKDQISIKLPQKALTILKYYEEKLKPLPNNYIFPFLQNGLDEYLIFDAISSKTAYLNKNLKIIGGLINTEKNISMHVSRHTWATRALRKGISIDKVSKLMGHTSLKTTQVYAKIVNTELDKAMDLFDE